MKFLIDKIIIDKKLVKSIRKIRNKKTLFIFNKILIKNNF